MKSAALVALLTSLLGAQGTVSDPGLGSTSAAQAAADAIRAFAKTDGAFLAAGNLTANFQKDNLATLLQFPTDQVVIVKLKGSDIRAAFERSVELYPQSNRSFLQVSGFSIQANATAAAGSRILDVTANGTLLDENKTYTIAMPLSLGRGSMGYYKIWDKNKFEQTLETTVEAILKGKKLTETPPRWSIHS